MSYHGVPGAQDRSGLYPSSGYPSAGYPQPQMGVVPGIPQVTPSATVAATHRLPSGTMSQTYAGMPLSLTPSGYYALQGYPTTSSGFSPYTPATQPSLPTYPGVGMTGLSSFPASHPYPSTHPHSAHGMQYSALQSMHTPTPSGYPSASPYRPATPSYMGSQLGSGLPSHPGNPVRIAVSTPLHQPGSPYAGAPLTSVSPLSGGVPSVSPLSSGVPRGYPSAMGSEVSGMPGLGPSPMVQHTSPFGGMQYPGY